MKCRSICNENVSQQLNPFMCGYSGHILHVVCFLLSWIVADFGLDTHYHKSWQSAGPPSHSNSKHVYLGWLTYCRMNQCQETGQTETQEEVTELVCQEADLKDGQ